MIECNLDICKKRYVGQSERHLKDRISEHMGYIRNTNITKTTGFHFNLPGHTLANMTVTVLEKVKSEDELYRKERESYFIRKFNTYYRGLNLRP